MNFNRDFNKITVRKLAKKGVAIIGLQYLPAEGTADFANGETGYVVNDNGTCRILTHRQVRELAESK